MAYVLKEKYNHEFDNLIILENIKTYFLKHNKLEVYNHTLEVERELEKINKVYEFDIEKCRLAVYLHDIGRVVENDELVKFCEENNHKFIEGEKDVPSILHQIASKIISRDVFKISDIEILDAIECHTTLRANPSEVDILVFLSDKLSWTEIEHETFIRGMREALAISKEKAVFYYQKKLYAERNQLKCYHKWSKEAYEYFL